MVQTKERYITKYNQKTGNKMEVTRLGNWVDILSMVFNIAKEKVDEIINPAHPFYEQQLSKIKTIGDKLCRAPSIAEAIKYGVKIC